MNSEPLSGVVLDERTELTIDEICRACSRRREWIIELVEEGVLEPHDSRVQHWRFSIVQLQRARIATRLQRDLGVNIAGIAVALNLLDEIHRLRSSTGPAVAD